MLDRCDNKKDECEDRCDDMKDECEEKCEVGAEEGTQSCITAVGFVGCDYDGHFSAREACPITCDADCAGCKFFPIPNNCSFWIALILWVLWILMAVVVVWLCVGLCCAVGQCTFQQN